MGEISADVVVVDNDSHDGVAELVATEFPEARTVWSANHGFGHANNRALMTCNARYVLFLNPDTEISTARLPIRGADGRAPDGRARRLPSDHPRGRLDSVRRSATFRTRCARSAMRCRPSGCRRRPRWLGEREIDPRPVRARVPVRLDERIVHARASRGARERRLVRRALLHVHARRLISAAGSRRPAGRSGTCRR